MVILNGDKKKRPASTNKPFAEDDCTGFAAWVRLKNWGFLFSHAHLELKTPASIKSRSQWRSSCRSTNAGADTGGLSFWLLNYTYVESIHRLEEIWWWIGKCLLGRRLDTNFIYLFIEFIWLPISNSILGGQRQNISTYIFNLYG